MCPEGGGEDEKDADQADSNLTAGSMSRKAERPVA